MPPAITDWSELSARAGRLFAGGLQDRAEQDEILLLQPALGTSELRPDPPGAGAARFRRSRGVRSYSHCPTPLQTEKAIGILERHDPKTTWGLLGSAPPPARDPGG